MKGRPSFLWSTFMELVTALAIFSFFGGVLFWGLTTALDEMTKADCEMGVQAACESLKK